MPSGKTNTKPVKRRAPQSSVLARLKAEETSRVLRLLLERHPDLETEATELAEALVTSVDVEVLARDVAGAVLGVGLAEMNGRAGRQPWGYVEPTAAAWEVLEEAVSPFIDDMMRLLELGSQVAATTTCKGIVVGLYSLRDTKSDGVLGWAPDFPLETAADAVSVLVDAVGARSPARDAALRLADEVPDWADALAGAERRG